HDRELAVQVDPGDDLRGGALCAESGPDLVLWSAHPSTVELRARSKSSDPLVQPHDDRSRTARRRRCRAPSRPWDSGVCPLSPKWESGVRPLSPVSTLHSTQISDTATLGSDPFVAENGLLKEAKLSNEAGHVGLERSLTRRRAAISGGPSNETLEV